MINNKTKLLLAVCLSALVTVQARTFKESNDYTAPSVSHNIGAYSDKVFTLIQSHRKTNIVIISNRAVGSIFNTDFSSELLSNLDSDIFSVQNVNIDFSSLPASNVTSQYLISDKIIRIHEHTPNTMFIFTNKVGYDVYRKILNKNYGLNPRYFYIPERTITKVIQEDIKKLLHLLYVGGMAQTKFVLLGDGSPLSDRYTDIVSRTIRNQTIHYNNESKINVITIKSLHHLRKVLTTIKNPNSVIIHTLFSLSEESTGIELYRVGSVLAGLNAKYIDVGFQSGGEESISLGIDVNKTAHVWALTIGKKAYTNGDNEGPIAMELFPSMSLNIHRLKHLDRESMYMNIFDTDDNAFNIR